MNVQLSDMSADQARVLQKWTNWVKYSNGVSENGLSFCFRTLTKAYILGTFLYQDYVIRGPSFDEAAAYLAAGANVYTMFFDTDTTFDFLSPGVPSCCGVAHAADLLYTFEVDIPGVTSESDRAVGQYIGEQFSSIINTGCSWI